MESFESTLYRVNDRSFANIALEVFRFQAENNALYRAYLDALTIDSSTVSRIEQIPFLPISFFKKFSIQSGKWSAQETFTSSGTTGNTSSHLVRNLDFYLHHASRCYEHFFGPISGFHFLALLPSYLERQGSSLVAMMDHFIQRSNSKFSSFYLHDYEKLNQALEVLKSEPKKTVLWGVTYALLDLAERFPQDLSHCIVMETGGMKGKRREITRNELWEVLNARLGVKTLFSEYGMTELLSQAYAIHGDFRFSCPPWMRIICRDITDPMRKGLLSESGGINIIDLANWNTISFIETEDLGRVYADGRFEILGRLDNSDLRGCNLMIG